MATQPVARRVIFSAWASTNPKKPVDLEAAYDEVKPLTGKEMIVEQEESLTAVLALRAPDGVDPALFQVLALRDYDNRPLNWGPGVTPEPIVIGQDRYTADITHVAIWSDSIAAYDTYPNAPGLGRLAAYLRAKAGQRLIFRPLYEQDLAERLKDLEGMRRVEYGIHTPAKVQQANASNFLGSLIPQAFGDKAPSINVALGMSRSSPRDAYLDDSVAESIYAAVDKAEQFFDTLAISGRSKKTGKTERINLLSQRIQVQREILRASAGGNLPDPDAVFEVLVGARKQVKARLDKAVEGRAVLEAATGNDPD
jgi:hypothetical protein